MILFLLTNLAFANFIDYSVNKNVEPKNSLNISRSINKIHEVANGSCFKDSFLKLKLTSKERNQSEKNISNEYILKEITSKRNGLKIDFKTYYKRWSRVVGYGYPNDNVIYLNLKYYNWLSICEMGSNIYHEWSHKIGYGHKNSSEYTSVPYSINQAFEKCCVN